MHSKLLNMAKASGRITFQGSVPNAHRIGVTSEGRVPIAQWIGFPSGRRDPMRSAQPTQRIINPSAQWIEDIWKQSSQCPVNRRHPEEQSVFSAQWIRVASERRDPMHSRHPEEECLVPTGQNISGITVSSAQCIQDIRKKNSLCPVNSRLSKEISLVLIFPVGYTCLSQDRTEREEKSQLSYRDLNSGHPESYYCYY